jgi:hypothetical protein
MIAYQYNPKTRQLERVNLSHHHDKIKPVKHFRNMSRSEIDSLMRSHIEGNDHGRDSHS